MRREPEEYYGEVSGVGVDSQQALARSVKEES